MEKYHEVWGWYLLGLIIITTSNILDNWMLFATGVTTMIVGCTLTVLEIQSKNGEENDKEKELFNRKKSN